MHINPSVSRYVVSVANGFSLVGVVIVAIILGGEILETLFHDADINIYLCLWILIFSAAVLPVSWLGTPKDMG
jgi:amino acid permease